MRRAAVLALCAPLYTCAPAFADDFVPPTIDQPTYERMLTFFHSTPMPYDISRPAIAVLEQLEQRAQLQKRVTDEAAKAADAAKKPTPDQAPIETK